MTENQKIKTKTYLRGLLTGIAASIVSTIIVGYMVIGQLMASNTAKIENNVKDIDYLQQEVSNKAPLQMVIRFISEYREDMKELKQELKQKKDKE